MSTKALIAGLLGGAAYFLLGFLVYGLALMPMMEANTMPGVNRAEGEMLWIPLIVSNIVSGLFLAYIFSKWANITTFSGGLKAGAIIGLFMALALDLGIYSTTKMITNASWVAIDVVAVTIMTALTGGVVGWWLGRGK